MNTVKFKFTNTPILFILTLKVDVIVNKLSNLSNSKSREVINSYKPKNSKKTMGSKFKNFDPIILVIMD